MTEDSMICVRPNCCRLCLAPDSECVSVFKNFAADKEPLALKIQYCVDIKILPNDRLSSRICHACISYLNSWQSFKNRCIASQTKQKSWIDVSPTKVDKNTSELFISNIRGGPFVLGNSTITKVTSSTSSSSQGQLMKVKDEPIDHSEVKLIQDDEGVIDPSLFLERNDHDDESEVQNTRDDTMAPPILSSLGLTQSGVHPYSFLSTELNEDHQAAINNGTLGRTTDNTLDDVSLASSSVEVKEASCRVCKAKFSTRANARRHERNIHPQLFMTGASPLAISPQILAPSKHSTPNQNNKKGKGTITPEMLGIYEYNRPEIYRHLLTEDKIKFIQVNDEFLRQYQTMTCKCCLKTHPTYKTFMAHMRPKYPTLPRNLCFKCLKQNESKALFISHLKKRNCINIFQIYHSDSSIDKTKLPPVSLDKMRSRELLAHKVYECKICSKSYRLKLEFRSHVYDEHSDTHRRDTLPGHCGFCGMHIEDPLERKRHYNNMDCIVFLKCVSCGEKFDTNQTLLDHVYAKHLGNNNESPKLNLMKENDSNVSEVTVPKQFSSRLPQSCQICGQQYNNYNNVLRHMESKHPGQLPETYKCTKCENGFPRLTNLRDHMLDVHGIKVDKFRKYHSISGFDSPNTSAKNVNCASKQQAGRYDYVMKDLLSINNGSVDETAVDGLADDADIKFPSQKKIKLEEGTVKECDICHAVFSNNIGLSNHKRSHTAQAQNSSQNSQAQRSSTIINAVNKGNFDQTAERRFRRMRCRICQKRFSSKKSYRRHMLADHQIRNVEFIKCKLCNAEFAFEKGLKVHMFKIHNTLLKEDMMEKQYECDICFTVYRNLVQLNSHRSSVHANELPQLEIDEPSAKMNDGREAVVIWFQCRYCSANFNTNKKLAIHINSHEEFDSNDYSCKDCGNVYSGRKSLWVHRYKKHPPIADLSLCNTCNKTFFDKKMLEFHKPNCTNQSLKTENIGTFKHRTGDDDDFQHDGSELIHEIHFNIPSVSCTICEKKFTDQDLFAKHIQMHEREMYTDNPLAAMFDNGPEDGKATEKASESGLFECDICPKTFATSTSLKVHRNWHFRHDSKQHSQLPLETSLKRKRTPLKCDYCSTSFMSSNNLKRHIAEIHRDQMADWVEPPKITLEIPLKCTKCEIPKFETHKDWVAHKISDAKITKPFAPFEWGCDICGIYLSRRERLIHHMMTHYKDINQHVLTEVDQNDIESHDSEMSVVPEQDRNEHDDQDEDDEYNQLKTKVKVKQESNDIEDESKNEEVSIPHDTDSTESSQSSSESETDNDEIVKRIDPILVPTEENEDDEDDEIDDDDDDDDDNDDDDDDDELKGYSCDLCQVDFESSQELQKHVTSHFLDQGSVTITEISKQQGIVKATPAKQPENDIVTVTPI